MAIPECSPAVGVDRPEQVDSYTPPSDSHYDHFTLNVDGRDLDGAEQHLLHLSRTAHAISYHRANLVTDAAILPDGYLHPRIDTARDYTPAVRHVAIDRSQPSDMSTVTIMDVRPEGDYTELPSMRLVNGLIYPEGHDLVAHYKGQGYRLRDVSSLGGTENPKSVFDVLRRIIQDATVAEHQGRPEAWLFALVTKTHGSLERALTPQTFDVIGADLQFDDPELVKPGVALRPLLGLPGRVFDNIAAAKAQAAADEDLLAAIRHDQSLRFFTNGVDRRILSDEVQEALAMTVPVGSSTLAASGAKVS
jgi:hypothetical protein